MEPDLEKLQSTTIKQAFKNNDNTEGSFTISGTASGVTTTITTQITVPSDTDIADIMFKGPNDSFYAFPSEPRPDDAWFKKGRVYARGDDAGAGYTNEAVGFLLSASINGNILTIQAQYFKTFIASLVLTPITVHYKVIDYSVF